MREFHLSQDMHSCSFTIAPHGADKIAEAVDGKDCSPVEWRYQEAARHVRLVMLHIVKLGAEIRYYAQGTCQFLTQIAHLGRICQPRGHKPGEI